MGDAQEERLPDLPGHIGPPAHSILAIIFGFQEGQHRNFGGPPPPIFWRAADLQLPVIRFRSACRCQAEGTASCRQALLSTGMAHGRQPQIRPVRRSARCSGSGGGIGTADKMRSSTADWTSHRRHKENMMKSETAILIWLPPGDVPQEPSFPRQRPARSCRWRMHLLWPPRAPTDRRNLGYPPPTRSTRLSKFGS